jgi:hypothetical protein
MPEGSSAPAPLGRELVDVVTSPVNTVSMIAYCIYVLGYIWVKSMTMPTMPMTMPGMGSRIGLEWV